MSKTVTIAVDVMGGDAGPEVTIRATLHFLKNTRDVRVILVGDEAQIKPQLGMQSAGLDDRLEILPSKQTVDMDEAPVHALRNKKESSMWMAVELVKNERAQACLSAGNTGALLAIAYYLLRTLPGIERPALITELPGSSGSVHMLDLGAIMDCKAENLLQFAVMGSVLVTAIKGIVSPRIGLLNVGREEIKGNYLVKEADTKLRESSLNYIGYVEADRIYYGDCDVLVADGFSGNISLKTSEGVAAFIVQHIRAGFEKNILTRILGLCAKPVMNDVKKSVDSRCYNGATLIGLQGVVVKSHGNADELAFEHALHVAYAEARTNVPQMIDIKLGQMLNGDS